MARRCAGKAELGHAAAVDQAVRLDAADDQGGDEADDDRTSAERRGAPYLNLTERANIVMADTGKEIYRTENFGKAAPPKSDKGSFIAQ